MQCQLSGSRTRTQEISLADDEVQQECAEQSLEIRKAPDKGDDEETRRRKRATAKVSACPDVASVVVVEEEVKAGLEVRRYLRPAAGGWLIRAEKGSRSARNRTSFLHNLDFIGCSSLTRLLFSSSSA